MRPNVLLQAPVEALGLDGIHEDSRRRLTLTEAVVELKLEVVEDLLGSLRERLLAGQLRLPLLLVEVRDAHVVVQRIDDGEFD